PNVSCTVEGKLASTPCKNRSFVVSQEDKFVPQFDMGSDIACDVTRNHGVTLNPIVGVSKFSSTVEVKKQEDNAIPSNKSLKSEQEHVDQPAAHMGQEMLDKGMVQDGRNKIVAAVPPCVSIQFVRQQNHDTTSEYEIIGAVFPTSHVPCSSAICGEIQSTKLLKIVLQIDVVPSLNMMSRCVTPSVELCEELLESDTKMKYSNMPLGVLVEGKNRKDNSTSTIDVPTPMEMSKVDYSTSTIAGLYLLDEFMNDSAHTFPAPHIEVQQNHCENRSHIAKLSESENKSELCGSTKCEVSIKNEKRWLLITTQHLMKEVRR
ncbi:hypothetical protein BAE44_0023536, partial [Dichanthelium oligosanthes]